MLEGIESILSFISKTVGNLAEKIIKYPLSYEEDSDGSAILGLIIVVVTLSVIAFVAVWLR